MTEPHGAPAKHEPNETPPEKISAANCYRLGHFDVRIGQANLVFCKLCGRVIHVDFPALGIRK